MSQPIPRYSIDRSFIYGLRDDPNGKFCEYRDYAALAADYVEVKDLHLKARIDIGNLQRENERLRKAGGAMMVRLLLAIGGVADSTIEAWNAAKEGNDAK